MSAPEKATRKIDATDEWIILRLANGLTTRQISRRSDLTEGTISNRISRAMAKTGAKTRTHLVVLYLNGKI